MLAVRFSRGSTLSCCVDLLRCPGHHGGLHRPRAAGGDAGVAIFDAAAGVGNCSWQSPGPGAPGADVMAGGAAGADHPISDRRGGVAGSRQFSLHRTLRGNAFLAAGMVASSLTEKRAAAFVLAFAFAAALDAGLNQGQSLNALHLRGTVNPPSYVMLRQMPNISMQMSRNPYTGFYGPTGWVTAWAPPKVVAISFGPLAEKFLIALLVLWVAMRFAGYCVERSWQDRIPSERRKNWVRRYCTPIFQRWFARQMRRTLEWNPVAWLQQYSWKARLTKSGLCLGFVVLECMATASGNFREIAQQQSILLAIIATA